MKTIDQCADLEMLARLAEGSLSDEMERGPLLKHLDNCRHCYTLFIETLKSLETSAESASQTEEGSASKINAIAQPHSFRSKKMASLMVVGGLAAAILLIAFLFRYFDKTTRYQESYQTAMADLAKRDGNRVTRFKFPTEVSASTFANRRVVRGAMRKWEVIENERVDETVRQIKTILARKPQNWRARLDLVALYLAQGQPGPALLEADKVAKQRPNDPEAAFMRALSLYLVNIEQSSPNTTEAVEEMRQIFKNQQNSSLITYNLARVLRESGDEVEAKKMRDLYLRIEREGPRAEWLRKQNQ